MCSFNKNIKTLKACSQIRQFANKKDIMTGSYQFNNTVCCQLEIKKKSAHSMLLKYICNKNSI